MYSYEQRVTAVKLLIQYDMSYTTVIQELGYPNNSKTLKYWYKEYGVEGDLHKAYAGGSKYTDEQKQAAVTYYLEHGRCISRACRKLGYPSREVLGQWIDELAPEQRKRCRTSSADVEYPQEVKEQAVIDLCARDGSAQDVADRYGVSRYSLYNWRKQLLGDGSVAKVKREPKNAVKSISDNVSELRDEVARLKVEAESLNREIYRLQLERDVLEKAAEIIKKDQGVNLKTLTNHEKAVVIDALRDKYRLKELLEVFHMSKSSYCYQRAAMRAPDKYESVTIEIRKIFDDSKGRYGYRRINVLLKKKGIIISEKVVRRIMKKEGMIVRCIYLVRLIKNLPSSGISSSSIPIISPRRREPKRASSKQTLWSSGISSRWEQKTANSSGESIWISFFLFDGSITSWQGLFFSSSQLTAIEQQRRRIE